MSSSSSSSSPCAACKFLRRKCTQGCVFAPYFPPDQPSRFANVHRVFGASNVAKLLNDLPVIHREDAVNSLAYEAEARLRDPIYGCVGYISALQTRLKQLQNDLFAAKKDLANYIGPSALNLQFLNPQHQLLNPPQFPAGQSGLQIPVPAGLQSPIHPYPYPYPHPHPNQEQQVQIVEAAMAAREHEMLRAYDQHQHQHHHQQQHQQQIELARFGGGFEDGGGFGGEVGVLTVAGPELALHPQGFEPGFPIQQPQPQRQELVVQQDQEEKPEVQQHHRRSGSDKDRSSSGSVMGPSC